MKSALLKIVFILVLWLPFSLGALASIFLSLWAIVFERQTYGKNVLRAMDKTLAAVCGFSGYFTLSAECGVTEKQPWVLLKRLLDLLQQDHCIGAARNEGLTQ